MSLILNTTRFYSVYFVFQSILALNIKNIAYLLFCLLMSHSVRADFEAKINDCTISNPFKGITSDNIEYEGVINISFVSNGIVLPLINVSLSRNIKPMDVSLSWSDADLLDSKERPIFEPEFQQRLMTERNSSFQFRKEGLIYYSKAYGFYRFQHFIALLLSQNNFKLTFVNSENSQIEELIIPLVGSDKAFREVVYSCYPNQVSDYINTDFSRKKPLHISWVNGYGITSYYKYEDYLPEEVRFPNDLTDFLNYESNESYKRLGNLYALLVTKSKLKESIDIIEGQTDYVKLRSEIEASANTVIGFNQRKDKIIGSEGILSQIDLEIDIIQKSISSTESLINIYKANLSPIEERKELLRLKKKDLEQKISLIDKNIKITKDISEKNKIAIVQLSEILKKYTEEYLLKTNDSELIPVGIPYSIDEIIKANKNIDDLNSKSIDLNRIMNLISDLDRHMVELVSQHDSALNLFNEISDLKKAKVSKSEEYDQTVSAERFFINETVGLDFRTIEVKISQDDSGGKSLSKTKNSDLKKIFQEEIKAKYKNYDTFIETLKVSEKDLISVLVCKTESFLKTFTGQCLNPSDIFDLKAVESYLDQLDSSTISYLRYIATGENEQISRYNSSLIGFLTEKISEQLKNESSKSIRSMWEDILFIRWKYSFLKPLNDDDVFAISWTDALMMQKDEHRLFIDKKFKLKNEINEINIKISDLNVKFVDLEKTYFDSLSKKQSLIINELQRSQIDPASLNVACLLEIKNVGMCAKDVLDVKTQTTETISALNEDIRSSTIMLVIAAKNKLTEMEQSLKDSLKRLNDLVDEKNNYISESNFADLTKRYDITNSEYKRNLLRIKSLYEQKYAEDLRRKNLLSMKDQTRVELSSLIDQIEVLTKEMQPTLEKIRPYCQEKNIKLKDASKVETEIYKLLSLAKDPLELSSICQIGN